MTASPLLTMSSSLPLASKPSRRCDGIIFQVVSGPEGEPGEIWNRVIEILPRRPGWASASFESHVVKQDRNERIKRPASRSRLIFEKSSWRTELIPARSRQPGSETSSPNTQIYFQ